MHADLTTAQTSSWTYEEELHLPVAVSVVVAVDGPSCCPTDTCGLATVV